MASSGSEGRRGAAAPNQAIEARCGAAAPTPATERRPRIGITAYLEPARFRTWDQDAALVPRTYVDMVAVTGGVPVLLPPVGDPDGDVLRGLDGLVLVGGADVDPARYGAGRHPTTRPTAPDRDHFELGLAGLALARDLPVLGVCRGAQVVNIALGGTLHQHVPDLVGSDAHRPGASEFGAVRVRVQEGSLVARLVGPEVHVHCHHHQSLDRVGSGLVVVGWSDDGIVEAVELPGHRFVVGVQWHPERDATDFRLMAGLVRAAAGSPAPAWDAGPVRGRLAR